MRPHAEAAHAGVELDVHADADAGGLGDERRRPADDLGADRRGPLEPVPVSGPKIRIGAVNPASRSSSASGAVATPSQVGPGLERGARRRDRAVPVAVGLDDGAVDGAVG